jgi:LuxR family transcriptional regulator, maltose regulon positive regulatory protein
MSVLRLDFVQAEHYCRQAINLRPDERQYPATDFPLFDLALLKYEQNDLEQAASFVKQGLEVNLRSGNIEMRAYGYRLASRLNQLRGQPNTAQEFLLKALRLEDDYNLSPLTISLNASSQVEMALWTGNLQAAEQAAPRILKTPGLYVFNFFPEMARVRLLLAQDKKSEALRLLVPAVRLAEQPGWDYPRLQVRLLQALSESVTIYAKQYLCEAIRLAMPAGAVRCFADLGEPIRALLKEAQPQLSQAERTYADYLITAFDNSTDPAMLHAGFQTNQKLVEPLTERELEVLALLAEGLSNVEIAGRLYLSPNTLKAHTQNIYSKLDVHSRVQVVNKARALGLIKNL